MRILIAKLRHIGDVLLVTPLLENLKAYYGDVCEIDLLINKGCEGIVENHPLISHLHLYPRSEFSRLSPFKRIAHEVRFVASLRARKFDIFISLTEGERSAIMAFFSGAKMRVGIEPKKAWAKRAYHRLIPRQGMQHTVEANLDSMRVLGIPIVSKRVSGGLRDFSGFSLPLINFAKEDKNRSSCGEESCADSLREVELALDVNTLRLRSKVERCAFVHIHPVSRWLFKCVNDGLIAEIVDRLWDEFGLSCVVTCSDDALEKERCQHIINRSKHKPYAILGGLSLMQISAINSLSRAFIGVDTAIMHLSAANDTPSFAFFGPSGAFHWGAWDNDELESGYRNRNGIQKMGRHVSYQDARDCVPCGSAGCNDSKRSDCLLEISSEDSWRAVSEFIKGLK
ncbi:MAG: glycosyltransferase family 9 protein [Wolinella sp.]